MSKTLENGSFQDAVGTVVNGGTIEFVLSHDAMIIAGGQVAPTRVTATLDSSGDMPGAFTILANDELTPSGTFYLTTVFDSNGARVFGPERWVFSGTSPIDLDTMTPTIVDPAFADPILSNPVADQTITGFDLFPSVDGLDLGSTALRWDLFAEVINLLNDTSNSDHFIYRNGTSGSRVTIPTNGFNAIDLRNFLTGGSGTADHQRLLSVRVDFSSGSGTVDAFAGGVDYAAGGEAGIFVGDIQSSGGGSSFGIHTSVRTTADVASAAQERAGLFEIIRDVAIGGSAFSRGVEIGSTGTSTGGQALDVNGTWVVGIDFTNLVTTPSAALLFAAANRVDWLDNGGTERAVFQSSNDSSNNFIVTGITGDLVLRSGGSTKNIVFQNNAGTVTNGLITDAGDSVLSPLEGMLSNTPRWILKIVDFGDMTAGATADTFTLWTLPANTMIHDIVGTVVTAWSGGSISAAVASVGTNAGAANDLTLDDDFGATGTRYELHDATASGGKGALLFDATDKFAPHMFVAGGVVEIQMDLTGDNHVNATAGQARIYALVSQPLGNTSTEAN